MEAWDVVVVGGGHAALRAAIAASEGGASTTLLSIDGTGNHSGQDTSGIASSLSETSSRGHRDDTIRAGSFLSDQDIVSSRTASASRHVAELERWGVNFRRSSEGLPLTRTMPGHGMPRVSSCGDTTDAEIQRVLEEQCTKRGIQRRGDVLLLDIISTENKVHGIVVLDLCSGNVAAIQCKSLIIADGGFEGAWNSTSSGGRGMDLAMKSGVHLRDMEFQSWTPFGIPDSEINLPLGLIAEGALVQGPGGEVGPDSCTPHSIAALMAKDESGWSIDITNLDAEASTWFASTISNTNVRLGLDPKTEPMPIEPRVDHTLGGIPVDIDGRAVVGDWQTVFSGLYAAGGAASSGLHGAGVAAGNRLLDDIAGGTAAGAHAARFAATKKFSGSDKISEALEETVTSLDNVLLSESDDKKQISLSEARSSLAKILSNHMHLSRNKSSLKTAADELESLAEETNNLRLDHNDSLLMNHNLVENLCMKSMIDVAMASVVAAMEREESRGTHVREDHEERDDKGFLKHSLVDSNGSVEWLPIRKSNSGSWLLSPDA